jgi:Ca2+-binding EF-hand superfamily protein
MIQITEKQMQELAEKFFKHDYFGIEDDAIMIDGSIHVETILAAADWIREKGKKKEVEEMIKELKGAKK